VLQQPASVSLEVLQLQRELDSVTKQAQASSNVSMKARLAGKIHTLKEELQKKYGVS
jgi:predicted lipoprotein